MNASPFYRPDTINLGGRMVSLEAPLVMGIINITEDSFFSDSRVMDPDLLISKAGQMISDGATIIDLGAMSSRPGAVTLPIEVEIKRLNMAISAIRKNYPDVILSLDIFRMEVLREIEPGQINMINDIMGGQHDEAIFKWAGDNGLPYILMHMKGTPLTMKSMAVYDDIIKEVLDFFIHRIPRLLDAGVRDIIIDPGFGFAKTVEQNFYLLKHLHVFQMLEFPIMVGLSRKSLIWKTLGITADDALNGTTALHMEALNQGARILRVHDVKAAKETVKLWSILNTINA
jgi:dihydropteroate synthase